MTTLRLRMDQLIKTSFIDIHLAIQTLTKYPEGQWFAPSNSADSNDFDVCSELAGHKLIARKVIPVTGGGTRVSFLYRHDMAFNFD